MKDILRSVVAWCAAAALLAPAAGFGATEREPNPYLQANDTWISIGGTVDSVTPDAFVLDYGKGMITVEFDDGDRDADAYNLLPGDEVTVHGRIDDDFFETTTIEAGSVYVEKLGTWFYASSDDEEDHIGVYEINTIAMPVVVSSTAVQGVVSDVRDEEFTLNTGKRTLTVTVDDLPYDPLDDEGYQKIERGDLVRVIGKMDRKLFEGRELVADTLYELSM